MNKVSATVCLLLSLILCSSGANAHIPPGGYLRLKIEGQALSGTWDLSLYSLAQTAGIENKSETELQRFALDKLEIDSDGATCILRRARADYERRHAAVHGCRRDMPAARRQTDDQLFSLFVRDRPQCMTKDINKGSGAGEPTRIRNMPIRLLTRIGEAMLMSPIVSGIREIHRQG